jgi:hypothetical protein
MAFRSEQNDLAGGKARWKNEAARLAHILFRDQGTEIWTRENTN